MFDRESILKKCRKVARINVESGATIEEAATAATLLARMLRKYQLSLADLDGGLESSLARDGCAIVRLFEKRGVSNVEVNGRQMELDSELVVNVSEGRGAWKWKFGAASILVEAFNCRCTTVRHEGRTWVGALGCASDAECVGYYWDLFFRGLTPLANDYLRSVAISAGGSFGLHRNGFWIGAAESVAGRIMIERSGNDGFTRQSQNRSLVVAKDAVMDRWCAENGYRKKKTGGLDIHPGAYDLGLEAGANLSLLKGIEA